MVPGRRYNVRYVLRRLRERWWWLLIPVTVTGLLAAVVARALPNIYYSQSTVVVVRQRVPDSYVRSTVTFSLEERLRTIREQVLRQAFLEEVMAQFDVYGRLRQQLPSEVVVGWMRRSVNIRLVKEDSFVVGFSGLDPQNVAKVADHLTSVVIRESIRERETLAQGTSQFLETELQQTRERLKQHEQRVEDFRRKYAGQLPSQEEANLRILQGANVQLQAVVEALSRDRDRRDQIARELAAVSAVAAPAATGAETGEDPEATKADADPAALPNGPVDVRLRAATAMLARLRLRLTPEHPDVKRLEGIIAELQKAKSSSTPQGETPAQGTADSRVAVLQQSLAKLDEQIAARQVMEKRLRDSIAVYQTRIESVPEREAEWTELTRDYNTLQGVYTGLLAKREESRIAASLERQQVGEQYRVVQRPWTPRRPVSPNRPFIAGAGLGIGLFLGLAVLVIRELRSQGLQSEDEVIAALALPVVGIVPLMLTAVDRRLLWRRRLFWCAAAVVAFTGLAVVKWLR